MIHNKTAQLQSHRRLEAFLNPLNQRAKLSQREYQPQIKI